MKLPLIIALSFVGIAHGSRLQYRDSLLVRQNNDTDVGSSSNASVEADLGNNLQVVSTLQHADPGGDDCGDGPVLFNADAWKKYDVDSTLKKFYEDGLSSKALDFNFALEWANKYGTDLLCRTASELCEGSVGTCTNYPGSDGADKSRGLLGLTAIKNAQLLFNEMWHGVEAAGNELIGKMDEFTNIFLKGPDDEALKALYDGFFGLLSGFAGAAPGPGKVIGPVIAGVAPVLKLAIFPEDDPLEDFSKGLTIWGTMQNALEGSLDKAHSAFFSNGDAGNNQTQVYDLTLPGFLQQGAMLDPTQYDVGFDILTKTMTSLLSIKLIEGVLASQNAFMIYIDGIDTKSCENWRKGHADLTTYCPPEGMYFLVIVDENGIVNSPQGWSHLKPEGPGDKDAKNWGGFNYTAQSLMHGTAWAYSENGLAYVPTVDDYKNMFDRTKQGQDVVSQKGAFNIPICWIRNKDPAENNWFQADAMSDNKPPIDCRCRDDGRGNKFYDHPSVSSTLKKWLDGALNDHGGNCPSFDS